MSLRKTLSNPAMKSTKEVELNEEWNNFTKRIGQVHQLVKDLASGDKKKSEAAKILADQYLDGKLILDEDIKLTVKSDRTVINKKAFKNMGKKDTVRKIYSFIYTLYRNNSCDSKTYWHQII